MNAPENVKLTCAPSLSNLDVPIPDSTRVLVAEDDRALGVALTRRLSEWSFEVDCCHDGLEALDALLEEDYDVLLLDLGLPRLSGCKLLDAIKKEPEISGLPIVVLTGGDEWQADRARKYGVHEVLRKPADSSELARAIREAITFGAR